MPAAVKSFPPIPAGVLAHLLDLCGPPGPMSPRLLMGQAQGLDPLQVAELYAGEYLTRPEVTGDSLSPRFLRCAQTILNPRTNLTLRTWGVENVCAETNVQFPGDISGGRGVALTPVDGVYHLAGLLDGESILADVRGALPPPRERESRPIDFEAHLDASVAAVLFALVDLVRKAEPGRGGASEVEIAGYLEGRWGLTHFDDLVSYVAAGGMLSRPPVGRAVESALEMLTASGTLVTDSAGNCALAPEVSRLAALTRGPLSGIQWQRVSMLESGERIVANRTYVFGDEELTLCFAPTVATRLLIMSIAREELLRFLIDEIMGVAGVDSQIADAPAAPAPEAPAATKADKPPSARCDKCHAASPQGASFCIQCGAPLAPPEPPRARFCTQCGAQLSAEMRFCTQCGAAAEGSPRNA